MNRHDNTTAISTEEQEDEPFYCSPDCAEEDVIWPGSDSEETAEENEQRRLRYEHHARRYMQGHLPVLQSAALRGPLSGWLNPWRWVSKQDEWWQPGSEDMLFTREKVMKRAADHGVGYLGPTEALAWCKASAQAEAQRIHLLGRRSSEGNTQPEIGNALIFSDAVGLPEDLFTKEVPLALTLEPTIPYLDQSMVNHHSETHYIVGNTYGIARGTKRSGDPHWLKGSYVSKRARWDDLTIATPTPHLELGDKHRLRHRSFPRRAGSDNRISTDSSSLSVSFADVQPVRRQMDITLGPDSLRVTSLDQGRQTSRTSAPNSTFVRSPLEQSISFVQEQEENIDELHKISQPSGPISFSRQQSCRKSQRLSSGAADAFIIDEEPGDLNAITPRQNSSLSVVTSGDVTQNDTFSLKKNKFPNLSRKTSDQQNGRNTHEIREVDVCSFITEVAPSSRGLETFQYRKKRKRMDSEALKPKPNRIVPNLTAELQELSGMISESGQNDGNEASDNQSSVEPEDAKNMKTSLQTPITDETQERSTEYDRSWDFIDGAMEKGSALSADNRALVETTRPKRSSRRDHNSPIPIPPTLKPSPKVSSQRLKLSLKSGQLHQSKSLPDPEDPSTGASAANRRVRAFQDLNYGSTQSYNTSPTRPTLELPLETLLQATPDHIQLEERLSGFIQGAMEDIQGTLSQDYPGCTFPHSTPSDKHQVFEIDDLNEVGSLHESGLSQRHARHPSDSNVPTQTSVAGVEMTIPRATEEISEIANVKEPQRAKSTPHRKQNSQQKPCRTENVGKDPESEIEEVSSTAKHTPHVKNGTFVINREQEQTRIFSSDIVKDFLLDEPSITSALGESRATAGGEFDSVNDDLQSSWEGCGPQSPWATDNLELPAMNGHARINQSGLANSNTSISGRLDEGPISPEGGTVSKKPAWHHVERPQTPPIDVIRPFKDLMSPTPAPASIGSRMKAGGLPDTQSLVDAATNNPWTSSLRNPSSKKSKKRVSFGVQLSEEKENSQPDIFDNFDYSKRNHGSPPPEYDSFVDIYGDGTATIPKFIGHIVAARQFKHSLLKNQSFPLNSSPRLSAQAEAFIAADREASAEKLRSSSSPRSPSQEHKLRRDRVQEDLWLRDRPLGAFQSSTNLLEKGKGNLMAAFDMDDAIGDMSDFLGDWSVDAELKKAKESEGSKGSESSDRRQSNGLRRRRRIGLA
jgi:hypothetical protein